MAQDPDDLFNQLKNVDRTVCGICKKKLVGASFLGNVNGQMVSLCTACKHTMGKKKKMISRISRRADKKRGHERRRVPWMS